MPESDLRSCSVKWMYLLYLHFVLLLLLTSPSASAPTCPGIMSFEKMTWLQPNPKKYPRGAIFYEEPAQGITLDCLNLCFQQSTCSGVSVDYVNFRCFSYVNVPPPEVSSAQDLVPSPGVNYFQKICYPGLTERFCPKFWSTDRVIGGFIDGFIQKEIIMKSRVDCSMTCLMETSFACRSASYHQPTQRCLLSVETRRTQPQAYRQVFDTSSWIYMENHCIPTTSSLDMTCNFDRRNDKVVASMDSLIYAKTVKECESDCLQESRFTCRSYSFHDYRCQLSSDDRVSLGSINEVPSSKTNSSYGELLCSRDDCIEGKYVYEKIVGHFLASAIEEELTPKDASFLYECQGLCDRQGQKCRSIIVDYDKISCFKCDRNSQGRSLEFKPTQGRTYLEKVCLKIDEDSCLMSGIVFSRIPGYEFPKSSYRRILKKIQSRQECEQKCLSNNQLIRNKRQTLQDEEDDPREKNQREEGDSQQLITPFICKSALYDEVTAECRLTNESYLTQGLIQSPRGLKSSHLENLCIPSKKYLSESQGVGSDPASCMFVQSPKEMIVYADAVFLDIQDVSACQERCRQGMACLSFSYSDQSKECILSSETKNTPGINVTKEQSNHDFYELLCRKRREAVSTDTNPTSIPVGTTIIIETTSSGSTPSPTTTTPTLTTTPQSETTTSQPETTTQDAKDTTTTTQLPTSTTQESTTISGNKPTIDISSTTENPSTTTEKPMTSPPTTTEKVTTETSVTPTPLNVETSTVLQTTTQSVLTSLSPTNKSEETITKPTISTTTTNGPTTTVQITLKPSTEPPTTTTSMSMTSSTPTTTTTIPTGTTSLSINVTTMTISTTTGAESEDGRNYCRKDFESTYERIPGFEPIGSYFFTLLCGSSNEDPGIVNQCSRLCDDKSNCQGFVVDYKNHLCYGLITTVALPHITLCVSDTKDFFNRICIPATLTCHKLYTFDRIVDQAIETPVLPRYTIPFITKEACKCLCLEEKKFICRSVSFEFNNNVCRVYELDRSSPTVSLKFERGFEYIENNCAVNYKPCSYSRPEIDVGPTTVIKSLPVHSIYECKHACDNTINFNCRSFNFVDLLIKGQSTNRCLLNADNHLTIKKGTMRYLPKSLYYERHCPG